MPSNDPTERFYVGAHTTETNPQGRAGKMSCTNVNKANLGSQLSIFCYGLVHPNDPPERVAPERPARTSCARTTRPNELRPNELTWTPSNDPTK